MDVSCIDESTSDSISLVSPATIVSAIPAKKPPERSLCRVGSTGASLVLDHSESGVEAESRKLPSSQYKGVVPQPNGRWGAQIYEKHQRVWLGTYNEEEEAAKAYDIAAQRFRGREAVINLKPLSETGEDDVETFFLNSHSKAEIVDMLRKHTYTDELKQSKRCHRWGKNGKTGTIEGFMDSSSNSSSGSDKALEHLFDKAVTPSDVGKLNRLVIPKQYAEKYFPLQIIGSNSCKGELLNFEDNGGKMWRFRYSYWKSSQSYVLTKGWSRFVKEKNLNAGDVVSFQRSIGEDKQLYIGWKSRSGTSGMELLNPVQTFNMVRPVQMVRLFGVDIFSVVDSSNNSSNWKDNRKRTMELWPIDCCKKQRILGAM